MPIDLNYNTGYLFKGTGGETPDQQGEQAASIRQINSAADFNMAHAKAQQLANQQAQAALNVQQTLAQKSATLLPGILSSYQNNSVAPGKSAPTTDIPQDLPQTQSRMPTAGLPQGVMDGLPPGVTPVDTAPEAAQPIATVAAADIDSQFNAASMLPPPNPGDAPPQQELPQTQAFRPPLNTQAAPAASADPSASAPLSSVSPDAWVSSIAARPAPSGSIRTPEGLVIRSGTPAASGYNASQAKPISSVAQAPAATGSETQAPSAPQASAFDAELSRQNAQKQAVRNVYASLVDDPSSLTRSWGAALLMDKDVQSNPALLAGAIRMIQQRQQEDAKTMEAKSKASTESLKAEQENHIQAHSALQDWFTYNQTEQRRALGYQPELAKLVREGRITKADADEAPQLYPGDAAFPALLAHLTNSYELNQKLLDDRKKTAETSEAESKASEFNSPAAVAARKAKDIETVANSKKSEAVLADYLSPAATATRKAIDEEAVTKAKVASAEADAKVAVAADTLADRNHLTPEQRQQAKQEQQKLLAQDMNVQLTPAALDKLAEMFATTGQLPALGNGPKATATRIKVVDKATENYPAVQFATNRAVFDANKSTLAKLSAQKELSEAFAQTAGKNLDTFLSTAKNVVDKGVPWINTPLRAVADKALGSEDQAAFKTARFVALSEIARVLTASPSGGGVVSDRARQEAEELIGPDATLKQVYKAATILQTDMKNRLESYDQSVKLVQGRIADMLKAQQNPAPTAADKSAQGGYEINHIYSGQIYLGGDPHDGTNWKKK